MFVWFDWSLLELSSWLNCFDVCVLEAADDDADDDNDDDAGSGSVGVSIFLLDFVVTVLLSPHSLC